MTRPLTELRDEVLSHCPCEVMRRDVDVLIAAALDPDRIARALHAEGLECDAVRCMTADDHRGIAARLAASLREGLT